MSREFLLLGDTPFTIYPGPRKEGCFIVCHLPSTGALKCGRMFPILSFIFSCCEENLQGGGSGNGGIFPLSFPALHFPSWILHTYILYSWKEQSILSVWFLICRKKCPLKGAVLIPIFLFSLDRADSHRLIPLAFMTTFIAIWIHYWGIPWTMKTETACSFEISVSAYKNKLCLQPRRPKFKLKLGL
jgi:hypothetical protein